MRRERESVNMPAGRRNDDGDLLDSDDWAMSERAGKSTNKKVTGSAWKGEEGGGGGGGCSEHVPQKRY
jgi:hypothetical protein